MFKEKVQELIKINKEGENKKKIENLIVLVIILVVTTILINNIWNNDKKENSNETTNTLNKEFANINNSNYLYNKTYNNDNSLETKLSAILESINGVGKVKVFINYSESSSIEAMYNETTKESSTEETDTSGGVRTIQQTDTQKDVIFQENNDGKIPVTQKVTNPTIEGAIITAQGAKNTNIKSSIIDAVSAATGLASHKIQVFEMKND